ncbi:MAG: tyrosine-type recombinase/integrase [Candidatus Microthrix sp.]|jgi:integrase/recombinase XerD|uniref:Tyrosine-type recombinase/integrase n=2 Tax=Candidatus Neomicrothrix TaxID=41949 RepID=A0A936NBD8_9ACTN|nr:MULTISPECIES: tyrosine-type recombinase/integrase [Microthrix]MBK9296551.1 tyrosine-type recombinase/integrase [Candidatus Microthrix subdominans]MBP6151826.1 tyrosine-type recombinase/integrase [Candidatus Microthrix sp.]MBP7406917.1 tyrosine-type recombinase/integrase [Candidatus Microthrix sp.]MBP7988890.1 tyrosine-type recombinase/integrase [Candidatus Microthrix sp.]MBP9836092.1 tyrosine-type recombinase/integrase [Candidatus Microthrix sp.]
MSALSDIADEYLALRRSFGHDLVEAHRLLPRFVAYLDSVGEPTVTVAAALAWAQAPDVSPTSTVWSHRMMVARGFARHMAALDERTEVPPPGLIPNHQRWRPPFVYSPEDIAALMAETRRCRWRLPAATWETVIGLLAATGMRVGEVIGLNRDDIAWDDAVLTISTAKFGKSRNIPLLGSTMAALADYAETRDRLCLQPSTPAFFVSMRGTRLLYQPFRLAFRRFCDLSGVGAGSSIRPRIHDVRHTFAVRTLLKWYQEDADVEALLPTLSVYLGHEDPRSTYWYLSAVPELLALAVTRMDLNREVLC